MSPSEFRDGRPRRYDLALPPGFACQEAARCAAALDELSERLFDLIADLPGQALAFVPPNGANSIQGLTLHVAGAEAHWVAQIAESPIPAGLRFPSSPGQRDPAAVFVPADLIALCRRVRDEFTKPSLSALRDADLERPLKDRPMTVRATLMHMAWHWTYHTGQVGLLRRLSGNAYRWRFA